MQIRGLHQRRMEKPGVAFQEMGHVSSSSPSSSKLIQTHPIDPPVANQLPCFYHSPHTAKQGGRRRVEGGGWKEEGGATRQWPSAVDDGWHLNDASLSSMTQSPAAIQSKTGVGEGGGGTGDGCHQSISLLPQFIFVTWLFWLVSNRSGG